MFSLRFILQKSQKIIGSVFLNNILVGPTNINQALGYVQNAIRLNRMF